MYVSHYATVASVQNEVTLAQLDRNHFSDTFFFDSPVNPAVRTASTCPQRWVGKRIRRLLRDIMTTEVLLISLQSEFRERVSGDWSTSDPTTEEMGSAALAVMDAQACAAHF
jgi:hypothetical protein